MRRNLGIIVALIAILTASCTQYVYIPIHTGGSSGSGVTIEASDVPSKIPEALLATYGLETDKTNLPKGVEVEQKIVPADAADTGAIIAFCRAAASPKAAGMNLVATIKLTNYSYGGATFNSEGIVITYPATDTLTGNTTYTVNEFTISSEKVEVTIIDVDETFYVAIKETAGKLQNDTASAATPVTVTTSSTSGEIASIINVPQSSTLVMDSWTGSYEVDNEEVSKPASEGMTGAADEPYLIRTLDDIARLQDMFDDADKVYIRLESDIHITPEWTIANLTTGSLEDGSLTAQPITVAAGQDVTIDFNHYKITFDGLDYAGFDQFYDKKVTVGDYTSLMDVSPYASIPFVVSEGGTLTINNGADNSTDVGGMVCTDWLTCGVFRTHGTLVINGGRFETCGNTKSSIIRVEETGDLTINNAYVYCSAFDGAVESYGKMTIKDGYYYTNSHNGGRFKYCIISGGDMILNGGEYYGIQGGISLSGGTATINYAESYVSEKPEEAGYTGTKSFYALYVSGEDSEGRVVVNDGIFEADQAALWVANSNEGGDGGLMLNGVAIINGGFFKSNKQNYDVQIDCEIGSMTLNGGTFVHDSVNHRKAPTGSEPATLNDFLGDGYKVRKNPETQLYEVVKEN